MYELSKIHTVAGINAAENGYPGDGNENLNNVRRML